MTGVNRRGIGGHLPTGVSFERGIDPRAVS